MDDDDPVGEVHDDLHDVFDEKNGDPLFANFPDEQEGFFHFRGIQPGHGLVQQEELWFGGQGLGDLQPLAVRQRESAPQMVLFPRQAHKR
jgi:hypothetical protein